MLGVAAAAFYFRRGLTLSHYDAKAHLVVARRIFDSRTPGWLQIGAVWLPLPHLLNAVPVQLDAFYRTGLSAVAMSVAAFALAVYAASALILRMTGSRVGALVAGCAIALNPNVLYLQATPMTESLLLGLSVLSVLLIHDWIAAGAAPSPRAAGWALVALCLTRYEGWLIAAAAVVSVGMVLVLKGSPLGTAARHTTRLAIYPVMSIVAFSVHSRLTIGQWIVTGGFFVPDNPAMGDPWSALVQTWWGTHRLAGYGITTAGVASAMFIAGRSWMSRTRSDNLIVLALGACALLPGYAFFEGHPFRIRYMVPLAVAVAIWTGTAIGLLGRGRGLAAGLMLGLAVIEVRPFDPQAPMLVEAQWDRPNRIARQAVTACLTANYAGERILMSMGSLAHYMQELSHHGFAIRDFVHEGNHPFWDEAVVAPQGRVGWIVIEEQAEGGDVLAARSREDPAFLSGFTRICSGGGVALHQAVEAAPQYASRQVARIVTLASRTSRSDDLEHLIVKVSVGRNNVTGIGRER